MMARKGVWQLTDEWLNDQPPVDPYVVDPALPSAVMCDIDGTLALRGDRGPYDFTRCDEDLLNVSVRHALDSFRRADDDVIVLLSGRGEEHREKTEEWLRRHGGVWFWSCGTEGVMVAVGYGSRGVGGFTRLRHDRPASEPRRPRLRFRRRSLRVLGVREIPRAWFLHRVLIDEVDPASGLTKTEERLIAVERNADSCSFARTSDNRSVGSGRCSARKRANRPRSKAVSTPSVYALAAAVAARYAMRRGGA